MNTFSAIITDDQIILAERNDAGMLTWTIAVEVRPENLAAADTMLAFHGYGRTSAWDLNGQTITAPIDMIDNLFNGTRSARLDQAVGTTHDEWTALPVSEARNGDLISDIELSAFYVVAGGSLDDQTQKIHMVGEGQVWDDHFTGSFSAHQIVQVARKR